MTNLDLSIQSLKEYTLRMIEKCEDAVDLSIEYTLKKDIRGLKKLIRQDDDIDILREYIRDRSIELMALKQPLARDLRYIYALSDISTELERIGDYSTNICKEIDELYEKVRKDCLQVMHSNPTENINQGVRLVFIGRYLERIGDHITNICEKIIYAKNGEMIEIG